MSQPQLTRNYGAELCGIPDSISHAPRHYSLAPPPASFIATDQSNATWRNSSVPVPMSNTGSLSQLAIGNFNPVQSQGGTAWKTSKSQDYRYDAVREQANSTNIRGSATTSEIGVNSSSTTSHPEHYMHGALSRSYSPQPLQSAQSFTTAQRTSFQTFDEATDEGLVAGPGPISLSELELRDQDFEVHFGSPEEVPVQYSEDQDLPKLVNQVSSKLSRREQYYAWIMEKELSEQQDQEKSDHHPEHGNPDSLEKQHELINKDKQSSGSDTSWDWIKEEVEPIMNIQHPSEPVQDITMEEDSIEIDLDLTYDDEPEPPLLQPLNIARAGTMTDQRHGSGGTQASVDMEISPEDQLAPQLCVIETVMQRNGEKHTEIMRSREAPAMRPGHVNEPFAPADELSFESIECHRPLLKSAEMERVHAAVGFGAASQPSENHILDAGLSSESPATVDDEVTRGEYQKDHRGFQVRPALAISSSDENAGETHSLVEQTTLRSYTSDGLLRGITPPPYNLSRSNSPYVVPSCVGTTGNSTPKRPDTPHPFSPMIRASVEREFAPDSYCRDSTPAYEDRSPSPSPTSRASISQAIETDTEMLDTGDENYRRGHRESSMPPELVQSGNMLPPPSPTRSRHGSPGTRQWAHDPSSPSTLRSPAIARVLHQTQSPHQLTRYPYAQRDLSPSRSRQPSVADSVLEPLEPNVHSNVLPSISSRLEMISNTTRLQHPPPPPIPEEPAPLQPAKRRGRRKSTVQESTAKVVKMRSVTGGIVVNGPVGKGKKITNVKAKQQRQRAVTAGLIQASESLGKGDLVDLPNAGDVAHDRVDVEMDVDAPNLARVDLGQQAEDEKVGKRRSARLSGKRA